MAAQYLVRLDDACPTMLRETWYPLEDAFDQLGIKPIIGVIPDNRDPALVCSPSDANFWDRVRGWQRKGWSIAMHGLHHAYHEIPRGAKELLTSRGKSEFAGIPLEQQRVLVRRSLNIFAKQGIVPTLFMAPGHSFDMNTLRALESETSIRVLADGHSFWAFRRNGFVWIPQQLWRFRALPFGTWSVCLHPNAMSPAGVEEFVAILTRYRQRIADAATVAAHTTRASSMLDRFVGRTYSALLGLKRVF
jgi:predicted deacetylase